MCGIAGLIKLDGSLYRNSQKHLEVMGKLIEHRGPDGSGIWVHNKEHVGFAHQRLSIIDLSQSADQPMTDRLGNWIVFNGEIYNYIELRKELGVENFVTSSDTEVILYAYRKWGADCVNYLRGMFAFAIWDESEHRLFCARDHFGIKPFYYTVVKNTFYFASEVKALLPFLEEISTDLEGFKDYLAFQLCLDGKTLFKNVRELLPAHHLLVKDGNLRVQRYWEVFYEPDFKHTSAYFEEELDAKLQESIALHLRADVPVGAYVSGGLDSSTIASIAADQQTDQQMMGFTGKFSKYGPKFDESHYAQSVADEKGFQLKSVDISADDFISNIQKVIYHLDYPTAGPGSFPQYMVSELAAKDRKVVLGGQGGDEIFGGYTRYLVAYFEQCIKGAIEGNINNGNYVVTYESIIPNLVALKNYKPMLQEFWREGLFDSMDKRYFQLVNRAPTLDNEINWDLLEPYSSKDTFRKVFNGDNVRKESYFDLMTHFDFKTLLPALLQVEDRMSMAHGLESRVPLLDRSIVELAATMPSDIKFKNGDMKHVFKNISKPYLPDLILHRKDKMGFPTPLNQWLANEASNFVKDIFSTSKARSRDLINNDLVLKGLSSEGEYSRKVWGLFSLEIWQQQFHDKSSYYRSLIA
jgi:asparagine synthase (glutamine-hydrolysing)